MRDASRAGVSAVLLVAMMVLGGVVLWVGIPAAWFYVGGRVQTATGSIGAALGVVVLGIVVSIALVMPALAWLSRKHGQSRVARGREDTGQAALEAVMVVSAGVALLTFVVWFFLFSGAAPIPIRNG